MVGPRRLTACSSSIDATDSLDTLQTATEENTYQGIDILVSASMADPIQDSRGGGAGHISGNQVASLEESYGKVRESSAL